MYLKEKNVNNILILFLFIHLLIWTVLPSLVNNNLPLDTIEALAWGGNLEWGYYKHPPLSAWVVEFFYQGFGNQDWVYYFVSQLFVVSTFFIIFKFSEDFFENKILSLISVLLLEGIYFYNFTTTEFNVNICQLPFWALTVHYCWKGFKDNNNLSWIAFGVFAGLGVLSKYLFFYLLISLAIFIIYNVIKKRINYLFLISIISFLLVVILHFSWLINNDFTTIRYALWRSGTINSDFMNHIYNPIIFIINQIGILIPFFIMVFLIIKKFKIKINYTDKRIFFLILINILPILFMFLTSLLTGSKIKTMWMTPFYLFFGVFIIYVFKNSLNLKKINNLFLTFLFLFILSPFLYFLSSSFYSSSRMEIMGSNYPGKKVAKTVQMQWDKNFSDAIKIVVGRGWTNEWYAGNLSYNLDSRPKWKMKIDNYNLSGTIWIQGFNTINYCKGVLYQIQSLHDICMVGKK